MDPFRVFCWFVSIKLTVSAFVWEKTPGTVHVCEGLDAYFPWKYDASVHDVTQIYWRFVATGDTVLAFHGDERVDYHDKYKERADAMDPVEANAGLVLKRVTPDDTGDYRVELSGPAGAEDMSELHVYQNANVQYFVNNQPVEFDSKLEVDWSKPITLSLNSSSAVKKMSIELEDYGPFVCRSANVCSRTFDPDDLPSDEVSVAVQVEQEYCPMGVYSMSLAALEGTAKSPPSAALVTVAVIVPVVVVAVVVAVVVWFVCCKKRREKRQPYCEDGRNGANSVREVAEPRSEPQADDALLRRPTDVFEDETDPASPLNQGHVVSDLPEPQLVQEPPPTRKSPTTDASPDLPSLKDLYRDILEMNDLTEKGYYFNEEGKLRSVDTADPFEFNFYSEHRKNQRRYEEIGEIIDRFIYKFMEERLNLEKVYLPVGAKPGQPRSFIFVSPDAQSNEKLIILIHGSGVVRAGQWARRLIINNDLTCGTQFPFIHWALSKGYGVMVLNTNLNNDMDTLEVIPESKTAEDHGSYVWAKFIEPSSASKIAIVAHSYGGVVVSNMVERYADAFCQRVVGVAFTDSVHSMSRVSDVTRQYFAQNAINWVSSNDPLNTEQPSHGRALDAKRVSAGHERHEWTSFAAMEAIFDFLEKKLR